MAYTEFIFWTSSPFYSCGAWSVSATYDNRKFIDTNERDFHSTHRKLAISICRVLWQEHETNQSRSRAIFCRVNTLPAVDSFVQLKDHYALDFGHFWSIWFLFTNDLRVLNTKNSNRLAPSNHDTHYTSHKHTYTHTFTSDGIWWLFSSAIFVLFLDLILKFDDICYIRGCYLNSIIRWPWRNVFEINVRFDRLNRRPRKKKIC